MGLLRILGLGLSNTVPLSHSVAETPRPPGPKPSNPDNFAGRCLSNSKWGQ